jgi:hypothetical protein|tara:strand:- start:128 stop:400 length:273 start_codon:yes stop_codon:yes gene_type:complete
MSKETIYCGGGKQVKGEYGTFRAVTINLSNLPAEHIFEYEGKKYVKLNISDKKEADQYGKDVSVSVNTWKPEQQSEAKAPVVQASNDLPF